MATGKLDFLEDDNSHLLVPVLVEGDQVTDVSVAHVGLLCQHSRHKHVVNSEDSFVAVLERLKRFLNH